MSALAFQRVPQPPTPTQTQINTHQGALQQLPSSNLECNEHSDKMQHPTEEQGTPVGSANSLCESRKTETCADELMLETVCKQLLLWGRKVTVFLKNVNGLLLMNPSVCCANITCPHCIGAQSTHSTE